MRTGGARWRRRALALGGTLFPDSPEPSRGLGRGESVVVGCSLLALAVILVLLRLGLSNSLNSLWAEDSTVFLGVALTQGFWEGVLAPYTNYLVLLPRLITEAATVVPIEDAPAAVSILSATVTALSGLAVWHATPGHIRSGYLRGALAAAAVLVPVASLESIDSAAYASWYMLFATFWLLFWRPRTDWGALLGSLFILLTALSNASVWFLVPLAVLRAITIRDRRDAMIVAAFAIGAAIQVPVALTHQQIANPTWSADIWTAYAQRIVDGAILGLHLGGGAWSDLGWSFLGPLLVLSLIGLVIGLRRAGPSARALAVIAVATSFVMFAGIAYQREVGPALIWEAGEYSGAVGRYAIVPALMLLSAAVVLVDSAVRRSSGGARGRWAIATTTLVVAVAIVTSFDESNPEARGTPDWNTALKGAARECEAEPAQEVAVPASPPGFGITLPCDLIPGWPQPRPSS